MIEYIDSKNTFRISCDQIVSGIRKRKTKLMPVGSSRECAEIMEKMMNDKNFSLRNLLENAVKNQPQKKGEIYAIKNEYLPGIVKIGMTCNSVFERIRNLNTAYPSDWQLICKAHVGNVSAIEYALHSYFSENRISKNREFFKINEQDIIEAIKICSEMNGYNQMEAISKIGN